MQQWTRNGANNKQWKLVPVSNSSIAKKTESIAEMQTLASPKGLVIYPNPVTDQLVLQMQNGFAGGATLKLSDVTGQTIYRLKIKGSQYKLSTSKLCSGVYLLEVSDGTKTKIERIIKK